MKHVKKVQFLFGILILLNIGCSNNDPQPSAKESLQNALANSTWIIDEASSDITGVSGAPDIAGVTISFTKSTPGASFTFGGEISTLIFGGEFDINPDGTIANAMLEVDESLLVNDLVITATETFCRISFTTGSASGRVEGIGSYVLTFLAN